MHWSASLRDEKGNRSASLEESHAIQSIHIINTSTTGTIDANHAEQHTSSPSSNGIGDITHDTLHVLSCNKGGIARLHSMEGTLLAEWNVPSDVFGTAYDESSNRLAVACKGSELRVYSLQDFLLHHTAAAAAAVTNSKNKETTATTTTAAISSRVETLAMPVYIAKGGKPNKVGLVDKPWNTAVAFLPGSNGTKILVGTGFHKLRLYDTAIGKRPQLDVLCGTARVTALATEARGDRCWVADGEGAVQVFDFKSNNFIGSLKGIAGSVRGLCVADELKGVVSVGLDRFLRVHSIENRKCIGKVYLKTQLTCVVSLLSGKDEEVECKRLEKEKKRKNDDDTPQVERDEKTFRKRKK